jgi:molybdate-binding protein/transcriptional regulator with XRE-family HTH domain
MIMSPTKTNHVRRCRQARRWSQQELAQRAGISRAAVSAIEQARLAPSVTAALALARALQCSVEELFADSPAVSPRDQWAWAAPLVPCRYWRAEIAGRRWLYPVESTSIGEVPHDGIFNGKSLRDVDATAAEQVLVVATCDPAVGLLASEYVRQTPFRMLPLIRSSHSALGLMNEGKVHLAGVHLAAGNRGGGNATIVRDQYATGVSLLRVGVWQEGIAFAPRFRLTSARAALGTRLKWVGRELGSGARQCLDELLAGRTPPRHIAPDHRGVALAIGCGWADAGVCLRLASEEAGLGFVCLRREAYDLCFPRALESDHRIRALIDVVRSTRYRRLLDTLPGYETRTTGELSSC